MESNTKILNFMINEHGEMYNLLVGFRFQSSNVHDEIAAAKKFEKFKEKLQPHHFAEENIVFPDFNKKEYVRMIRQLTQQHNFIEKKVKEVEKQISQKEDTFASSAKLEEMLREHIKFEEKSFYPKLDKALTDKEKNDLIKQFTKVIEPNKSLFEKINKWLSKR